MEEHLCVVGVMTKESVPQVVQAACHHGDAQTNKPTKFDDRLDPLVSHYIMLVRFQ